MSIDFSTARDTKSKIPPFFGWCTNRKGSWIGRQPIMHLRISCRWQMTQQLSLSMWSLSTCRVFGKKWREKQVDIYILTNLWNISRLQQNTANMLSILPFWRMRSDATCPWGQYWRSAMEHRLRPENQGHPKTGQQKRGSCYCWSCWSKKSC